MRRIVSFILAVATIFVSTVIFSVTGVSAESTGFYLKLKNDYTEGDSSIVAELYLRDPESIGVAFFGLGLEYSDNMVLRKSTSRLSGVYFSESVVKYPYMIFGVADEDTGFTFPFEDTLIASFELDIIDSSYDEPFTVDVVPDPKNNVCDLGGNILDDVISFDGIFIEIEKDPDDPGTEPEPEIPEFNDSGYTGSDKIYINENFTAMENVSRDFLPGAFFIQDSLLYGWPEAKALQSNFTQISYNGNSIFDNNSPYVWKTYDVSVTLSLSSNSGKLDRWINLCYCNDNLIYAGLSGDRQFITFSYDRINGCFRLADSWCTTDPAKQFMSPVYRDDVCTDGSEFMRLGMSVDKNRIRCFYNDELIFDYVSREERIANFVGSPFLLWNEGNITRIANVTIAEKGYLFPETGTHTDGFVVGSDGLLLNYYGNDTAITIPDNVKKIGTFAFTKKTDMKTVILPANVTEIEQYAFDRCRTLTVRDYGDTIAENYCANNNVPYKRIYDGDTDDSGFVNASDITLLARKLSGAEISVSFGADFNRDGKINTTDLVGIRRWLAS